MDRITVKELLKSVKSTMFPFLTRSHGARNIILNCVRNNHD